MELIKKLARHILRAEIKDSRLLSSQLHEASMIVQQNLTARYNEMVREAWELERDLAEAAHEVSRIQNLYSQAKLQFDGMCVNGKELIPQEVLKFIVETLPDANAVGVGIFDFNRYHGLHFVDRYGTHSVIVKAEKSLFSLTCLRIIIPDYHISVSIPCVRNQLRYSLMGFNTEVDTYVWDLDLTKLQVLSDEAFKNLVMFANAQVGALTDIQNGNY